MAEKGSKTGKRAKPDEGVLANLPSTRPSRLSRRASAAAAGEAPAKPVARKPAKPKAAKPKQPAKVSAAAKDVAAAAQPKRPRAVRAASPRLKEPIAEANARREDSPDVEPKRQSGPELATTVVKAAGELASIGLTIGGQVLKRTLDKLPKP